jgi:hypothetical protein
MWQPQDDGGKLWYFTLSTCDQDKQHRVDVVNIDASAWGKGRAACEEARDSLVFALMQRRPLVIHDMDDEVATVRLCETLWPGERISQIRADVEAEYRARGALD